MKHFISLGAGVQSSTMALMAAKGEITPMPDGAIFADTGAEPASIYQWLDWLETQLPFPVYRVKFRDIESDIFSALADPESGSYNERVPSAPFYTESPNKKGSVGMLMRQCTSDYKVTPIIKKIRELVGLKPRMRAKENACMWIGISLDEVTRMKPNKKKWIDNRWPLIESRMTRTNCLQWMERNGYPLPEKSSCVFCPYHDNAMWRDMKLSQPVEFERAVQVDRAIRNGVRGTTQKLYLHQSLTPLEDVDFRNLEDMGQLNLFENECEGMCGV